MAKLAYRPPVERPVPVLRAVPALGPITHAVLRIGAGLLFFQHGLQKFGVIGGKAAVPLASQMGVAGVLELVGGLLIVLGLFTRPVAVVLAAEMLIAYLMAHAPRGALPIANGGEVALLFALIFVFLAGNGPGAAAIDTHRR
ncbi:MAG TPA: DoxX family protein [Methylomirabilota bacterium]|jgi:putative oxidoreductase|nr:DoxX family protein [Methylomirabilota bacterium]